ncbi:Protease HtpX [Anaerobiospirillum thomasii]|uniref:Protease HtpX n=1 Tax=Anaerobiospirillum thomasii TaxID=179995 RepID=A0A2X0X2A9_9GAMM|nr:protease HtpX [Anaerobiospirillum thomasii]SPT69559.1 Protease HtpX [Anaerobiospirillum thomasii]SPT71881.1 Protease HtpX [Anaerobiospirillum thomasii]
MRIMLFILMQLGILVVVGIVGSILMNVFNIRISSGSYTSLLIMCAIYGFVGSFISLFMSKWMCKKAYGVNTFTTASSNEEAFLLDTIAELSQKAGIAMPEVGIYESDDPNAFATGASKNAALVAVSRGLLNNMSQDEVKGVLGHEISHIANGDMVTMSLLQGVLNTFVYFFSYIAATAVSTFMSRSDDEEGSSSGAGSLVFFITNMLFQILFGILAQIVLMWFSRYREFKADEGSARLEGKECMIQALEALKEMGPSESKQEASMQALCINGGSNLSALFLSHPPLDQRIEALRRLNVV